MNANRYDFTSADIAWEYLTAYGATAPDVALELAADPAAWAKVEDDYMNEWIIPNYELATEDAEDCGEESPEPPTADECRADLAQALEMIRRDIAAEQEAERAEAHE